MTFKMMTYDTIDDEVYDTISIDEVTNIELCGEKQRIVGRLMKQIHPRFRHIYFMKICFVCFCPSQQLWSCWDIASILWDFYPTLGCHDSQYVLLKYSHVSKQLRLIHVFM